MKNPLEGQLSHIVTSTAGNIAAGIEAALQIPQGTIQAIVPTVEGFARQLFNEPKEPTK